VFPFWLRFRGGKAGATGLGVGAVLSPVSTATAGTMFLLVLLATRYVSLSTMSGAVAYLASWFVWACWHGGPFARQHVSMSLLASALVLLVIVRHRDNIKRLLAGTEGKIELWGKT
jgi:glycerol-3-phosphate acyltransferase PlsY